MVQGNQRDGDANSLSSRTGTHNVERRIRFEELLAALHRHASRTAQTREAFKRTLDAGWRATWKAAVTGWQ
jgi:hypothetical protein